MSKTIKYKGETITISERRLGLFGTDYVYRLASGPSGCGQASPEEAEATARALVDDMREKGAGNENGTDRERDLRGSRRRSQGN